jgi:hypothetical protein
MEGLWYHMQKECLGELKALYNSQTGPSVSHLLFADNSIFFA